MSPNLTIHLNDESRQIMASVRRDREIEALGEKILRDTEQYLNHPQAATWGRLELRRHPKFVRIDILEKKFAGVSIWVSAVRPSHGCPACVWHRNVAGTLVEMVMNATVKVAGSALALMLVIGRIGTPT